MHHPAHHCAQGKDAGPVSQRVPQKGRSPHRNEAAPPTSQGETIEPRQAVTPPEPTPQRHHTSFHTSVGTWPESSNVFPPLLGGHRGLQ
ncbi:hypothetical protein ATANTOWER_011147 [Ataeniobius toweri]|uniref:Uncharacterized protein n=1 Tax=Ataeniobius toweri TaxID=208326 RepID=A0ABU7C7K5_9TELE|nr:hypothetical protein [Ataeniobius toweri]